MKPTPGKPPANVEDEPATLLTTRETPSGSLSGAFAAELHRYDLKDKLGAGGMAAVFRATDRVTGDTVALKLIEDQDEDPGKRTRFEREVRAAGRLVHVNVCRVLTFGKAPGKLFMAMELVEGVTLQKVIKLGGTVPVPIALECLRQLLRALECAGAAGVVHRDLKPANVMITPDGTLKLLDFGIAKSSEDATVTATGLLVGTPAFMSPEQILGGVVDGRSDLFSAGVTFLVMLTGRPRFMGLDPAATMVKVTTEPVPSLLEECVTASNATDRFLARLCAQSQDQRFQTATEALEALAKLDEAPVERDGPALLARYITEPQIVAADLAKAQAHGELLRGEKLEKRGEGGLPAAALAYYRASLLDPIESTRKKLEAICKKGPFTFDPIDDDVKIAEAYAAFQKTPIAPGVLKRLADLYRARGQIVYAGAFLTRYLRQKPNDSHAAQQLSVMLNGPDGDTGTGNRLLTRDIVAGIKTGGHVNPQPERAGNPQVANAMGPLTAAGLRPPSNLGHGGGASGNTGMQRSGNTQGVRLQTASQVAARPSQMPMGNVAQDGQPRPQVVVQAVASDGRMSLNISPLVMLVGAVIVAGLALAFFSKFVTTSVDVVQKNMSDNEEQVGRVETNNVAKLRKGYLEEARAQLELKNPNVAVRQVNLLLATDPPADQALEGIWLRANARLALREWRSARADLEEYMHQAPLSDPKRTEAKKMLMDIHEQVANQQENGLSGG